MNESNQRDIATPPLRQASQTEGMPGTLTGPSDRTIPTGDVTGPLQDLIRLYSQGEMVTVVERALSLTRAFPSSFGAWNVLGAAAARLGRLELAVAAFRRAIELQPKQAGVHSNLGSVLQAQGRFDEALIACQDALRLNPEHAEAYNNLGNALQKLGRVSEAVAAYERALALRPQFAEASSNLSNALLLEGRLDEAVGSCRRALSVNPHYPEAHINLGNALKSQGRFDEARGAYERALAIDPDCVEAHWNRSLVLLLQGEFREGWQEYEWRWKRRAAEPARASARPLWLGQESLHGKTILLWGEQGLGDQIQFARFAEEVSKLGARVILELKQPLMRAFHGVRGVTRLASSREPVGDEEFDYHCPLMSLPLALQSQLAAVPRPVVLRAHTTEIKTWQSRLAAGTLKIGLAWSGNARHTNDRNRSIPLAMLSTLLAEDAEWISLQKEVRPTDRATLEALPAIRHFGDTLDDFVDTAALCENCDLIISVDTSVAHLAASIGRPVWLLLPFVPDWRWLCERDSSPWYPSVRIYRQTQAGEWHEILRRLQQDLRAWLAGMRPMAARRSAAR